MLTKNKAQLDMFDYLIFQKLIPKEHLLVKIDGIIDFSFVYELVKDQYSPIGRGSKDPAMMVKIFLLEFLYRLSDVQVVNRIQTDIVFRELCPTQTYMVVFRRFPRHQLINLLE